MLRKTLGMIRRLGKSTSGNVAVICGLALVPIVSIIGFTIDFQTTTGSKNRVQSAIDSAVLVGARAMQDGKSETEIRSIMREYLKTMGDFHKETSPLRCRKLKFNFPDGTQDITADVECEQDTGMMHMVGKPTMTFKVSSTSTWGIGKLDVAFMFDVSGSMGSNNRMKHLKGAAQEALDTLLPAGGGPGTEHVRVAMVSYNDMVNAGDLFEEVTGLAKTRTYYAIDNRQRQMNEKYTTTERKKVKETYETTQRKKVKEKYWTCTKKKNGQCTKYGWKNRWVWKDVPVTKTRWVWKDVEVEKTRKVWQKYQEEVKKTITSTCVWERTGKYKFTGDSPNGSGIYKGKNPPPPLTKVKNATKAIYNASKTSDNSEGYLSAGYAKFNDKGDSNGSWSTDGLSCRKHVPIPLSRDRTLLSGYITSLTTGGGTAGHQGIAWSWHMIAEQWQNHLTGDNSPLDYTEPDSVKAVILMTDGDFLHQEFSSQGKSMDQAKKICDEMRKQDGLLVYTVAFQAPKKGKEILAYCASGPEFAFAPQNGEQLSDAYKAIATSISDLRIKF
ncbi:MAG: TadE/TadG family type IV pilus assembly protein [Pseudomonadota bacterium]